MQRKNKKKREGRKDGQRKKMSNARTEDGNEGEREREAGRGKQMSARSHQLGAGILKQNV